MRRRLRLLWILLLLLVLAGAHVAYWYWPRERAAVPDPSGAAFQLLSSGPYDLCLWVPYPHQNLGALGAAVGDLPEVIGAVTRLAGSATTDEMRTFGPFLVPPAHELVACSDLTGGRLRIAARVYPGLAVIAKLAGRLAGNAWLAGGEVGRLRVDWQDGLWIVTGERKPARGNPGGSGEKEGGAEEDALSEDLSENIKDAAAARAGGVPADLAPGLAVVHLSRPIRDLPAGSYLLRRDGADLALDLVAASAAPIPDLGPGPRPALLVAVGPAPSAQEPSGPDEPPPGQRPAPPAALALFAVAGERESGGASRDLRAELPGVAVFQPIGERGRWRLPGGTLGRLLNGALPHQDAAGWSVLALDDESLRQAVALAPRLAALVPPRGPAAASSLTLGLWMEPRPALEVVSRVRRFLDGFPFAPRRQARRWRDWQTVLTPLAACRHAALAASASASPFFHLRLESCRAQ